MPVLKHTTPCGQCPWRRGCAPGWLGASSPQEFLATTLAETHMPCHTAIDYERPDWRAQAAQAPFCAGALTFLKNICKLPRDDALRVARENVQPDREAVFARPEEFLAHHSEGERR